MTKETGSQAFPGWHQVEPGMNVWSEGMTLRQWYAGQALAGILSGKYGEVTDLLSDKTYKDAVARVSYEFADAMLSEGRNPPCQR